MRILWGLKRRSDSFLLVLMKNNDIFSCTWFAGHLWPGTGREYFSHWHVLILSTSEWHLGKDIDIFMNISLGSGKMAELSPEVLCVHWDTWCPTNTYIFLWDEHVCSWVSMHLPSRNRGLERIWDTKYFCVIKTSKVRWGKEAGSFVGEVRLSYSLLQCKVFTYEPGVPRRLSNVFSEEATQNLWVSPGLRYWPPFFFCSVEAASIGFIIVIDRRRDKWSSIKASLTRIAVNIYFCAFFIQVIQIFIQLFYIKVTRKRWLFYVKFWESLCSRGYCVTSVSPLPPEGHCREFLSTSKASWVSLLYWFLWSLKRCR